MKAFKVLIALIISIGLLCCQILLIGVFSSEKALSAEGISAAIGKTDIVNQVCENTLDDTILENIPGSTDLIKKGLHSEIGTNIVGEYASKLVFSVLRGDDMPGFTGADVKNVLDSGIENSNLDATTSALVSKYVSDNQDTLASQLNNRLPSPTTLRGEDIGINQTVFNVVQTLYEPLGKILIAGLALVFGVILIALFWESKLGFMWWSIVSFISGLALMLSGLLATLFTSVTVDSSVIAAGFGLLEKPLSIGGVISFGFGVLLIIFCITFRKLFR
ncbi:MAG: hypothetical protein RSD88_05345 [Anaerovoracaceae bacterium]